MSCRASLVYSIGLGFVAATLLSWTPVASAATEYTSQNSASTFIHSAVCTTTGDVWDNNFANYVNTGIGSSYNEIEFDFNECFSGGMVDELQALNLVPAAYTTAARYNQLSLGWTKPTGQWESSYSYQYMLGVAAKQQASTAASNAHDADIFGPVAGPVVTGNPAKTYLENPQYTSSGPLGDGIVLGGQNANNNPVANNNYIAVLFAGNDLGASDPMNATTSVIDYNSLVRSYNTLLTLGYAANNIYVMYPYTAGSAKSPTGAAMNFVNADATAANLKSAWTTWVKGKTTANTQIFYWNGMQHGTEGYDVLQALSNTVTNAQNYAINLGQQFVTAVQSAYTQLTTLGINIANALPMIDVQTSAPMSSDLDIYVNGDSSPLTEIESSDLYGDGTVYDYEYALSGTDDMDLTANNDDLTFDYTGSEPDFTNIELTLGNDEGDEVEELPEPASMSLLALSVGGLALRRRSRSAVAADSIA